MQLLLVSLLITFSSSFYSGECKKTPRAPALYVFGDSSLDNGNNNWLPNVDESAKSNYHPYGIDFRGGIPTGRVTNGRNVADFIAKYLHLPSPPPHARPDKAISLTGYNYASAGCGILEATGAPLVGCMPLHGQINSFDNTKKMLNSSFQSPIELDQHLANSIFFIWVGSNDYLLRCFIFPALCNKERFANTLVSEYSDHLKRLIDLGARKFLLFEVGPLGCPPYYTQGEPTCDAAKNEYAAIYNDKLHSKIRDLAVEFPSALFSIGKINWISQDAFDNPTDYGLKNVSTACCELKEAAFGRPLQCKDYGLVCPKRNEYLFFDAVHPTEAAYHVLSERCISDTNVCAPTLKELVAVNTNSASLHSAA